MANEKRLIDADAFIEDIKTEIVELWLNGLKGTPQPRDQLYDIINRIGEQPTVDAVPVVHGRWNEINQITTGLPWKYRCNECGCPQDYKHNYCPNCGAKMDGDGDA